MQQAILNTCNKSSTNINPNLQISKNCVKVKSEIEGDPGEEDHKERVKVKLEVVEENILEPKIENQEDFRQRKEYREVKPASVLTSRITDYSKLPGFCQPPNPGYQPVGTSFPTGFGYPHFYGPHTTFLDERSPGRVTTSAVHRDDRLFRSGTNNGFFNDLKFNTDFLQGKLNSFPGSLYPGYRPSVSQPSYLEHRNNRYYNRSQYSSRQRKWTNSALRALQPPTPVSFFKFCISFKFYFKPKNKFFMETLRNGNKTTQQICSRRGHILIARFALQIIQSSRSEIFELALRARSYISAYI